MTIKERNKCTNEDLGKSIERMSFRIYGWMVSDLKLKTTSLIAYAVIYSFFRDGKEYYGTEGTLAYICRCSRQWINVTLKKLTDSGLIIKRNFRDNDNSMRCIFTINPDMLPDCAAEDGTEISPENL